MIFLGMSQNDATTWTGDHAEGQYDAVGKWKYLVGLSYYSYGRSTD